MANTLIQDEFTGKGTPNQRHYWRHKTEISTKKKLKRELNTESAIKERLYSRKYYSENLEYFKEVNKKRDDKRDPLENIWRAARTRSRKKNLEFDIEFKDLVVPEICPILNIPLFHSKGSLSDNSPSVDRLDNSKGYTKDNIRIISHRANTLKSNMNREQVQKLLDYMDGKI